MTYPEFEGHTPSEVAADLQNDARTCQPIGTGLTQQRSPSVLGYTYFIRRHDGIKIGRVKSLDDLPELCVGYPEPLSILATVPAWVVSVGAVKEKFDHLKGGRGWFRAEPELLEFAAAARDAAIFPPRPEPVAPIPLHPAVEALREMARKLASKRPSLPPRAQRFASNLIEQGFGAETPEDVVRLQPFMAKQAAWFRAAMAEASRG